MTAPPQDPVLVTGATGFVGSHLVRRLVDSGYRVVGLSTSGNMDRLKNLTDTGKDLAGSIEIVRADIRDSENILGMMERYRFRTVFHVAAAGVHANADNVPAVTEANTAGSSTLGLGAVRFQVESFVYCGSGFEYLPQPEPIDETRPIGSHTLYGASKAAGWLLLDYLARMEGLPLKTLRPFTIYGPGESTAKLIPYSILSALERIPRQFTAGLQIRDFLYVSDVVDAMLLAAEPGRFHGEIFNICSGPEASLSVRAMVETIFALAGAPTSLCSFGEAERTRPDPPYLVGDPIKARQVLGWSPKVKLTEGLQKTMDAYAQEALATVRVAT